ncbi:MAG: response regulator [Thermodesulfobacteriota bacterium]|nr:response regulator [Thermodesulfobacteriota bacterium]
MDEEVRILCVDDEENVLRALKRLFLEDDYEIITATSGAEGIKLLEGSEPIHVVVSDYKMPEMDGIEFLKQVRERWPDIVRIVLSGYADTASVVDAVNEGHIYKFMPKPWNDDELRVTIANAVERYFLHAKNVQLTEELQSTNEELQIVNDNLEKLVEERTSELMFQNQILERSQHILDSLPVAVIGVDLDGLIVQCNKTGADLLAGGKENIIGMDRGDFLPEEINTLIERIIEARDLTGHISINKTHVKVRGSCIKHSKNQEGVVLVFDKEDDCK